MIPNIFHFIYFYPPEMPEFPLAHFICVNSARVLNKPDAIFFYSDKEPTGHYWDKIQNHVKFIKTTAPEEIFGNKLYHIAHKSDVLRLEILRDSGGIYLDMDTICKKPFAPLLKHDFVLGKQGKWRRMGLCNGVIMSSKNSEFSKIWINEFKHFRSKGHDRYWAEISVQRPLVLSKKYPGLIHVEPYDSFHYPLYYSFDVKRIFEKCIDFKNAYCHHYWDGSSWEKYLKHLDEDTIKTKDTTYNVIARKYL